MNAKPDFRKDTETGSIKDRWDIKGGSTGEKRSTTKHIY